VLSLSQSGRILLGDARRNVRVALGLPKDWVSGFNTDVTRHAQEPCPTGDPIVIVTGGQSNASNAYEPVNDPPAVPGGYMFFGGHCYALKSPVLGATGTNDSLWPKLGEAITNATQRPVVFINGAAGGSQLGDWLDERSKYLRQLLDQVQGAKQAGLEPDFVMWIQGETDAKTRTDPALYVQQMRTVVQRFEEAGATAPGTRWILFRSTRCKVRPNNGPDIERALTAYTEESSSDAIIAGPQASVVDDLYRRDQCHFNNRGRDRLVNETLQILQPLL